MRCSYPHKSMHASQATPYSCTHMDTAIRMPCGCMCAYMRMQTPHGGMPRQACLQFPHLIPGCANTSHKSASPYRLAKTTTCNFDIYQRQNLCWRVSPPATYGGLAMKGLILLSGK